VLTSLMTLWAAAVLGQAPAEAAWLKSVPADVEIVARVRGLEAARDDLVKMIEAMSPTLGQQANPALEQALAQLTETYGKDAATTPFLFLFPLPKPEAIGTPPYAFLIKSDDYASVQKHLAGDKAKPEAQPGGYDLLIDEQKREHYTYKGAGFVAFGNDPKLMATIAQPKQTLDKAMNADLQKRLFMGDAGVYVNLAKVQQQYKDQIDKARQTINAQVENAARAGGPNAGKASEVFINAAFDALRDSDALALSFDFDAKGLDLSGQFTARSGSDTAKTLTGGNAGSAQALAKFPPDLMAYVYARVHPSTSEKLQGLFQSYMANLTGADDPEVEKAIELQRQAGLTETVTAMAMDGKGLRGLSLFTYNDPKKAVEAITEQTLAQKKSKSGPAAMIKDIQHQAAAERYRGFTLDRTVVTFDPQKYAEQMQNMPNADKMLQAVTSGGKVTTWYGTDGKQVVSVVAPTWDEARTLLDQSLNGRGGLGQTEGYRRVRAQLPEQANLLVLVSMQGVVRQLSTIFGAAFPDNPALKAPADLPSDPALIGVAAKSVPNGLQFQFVLPSAVGPVVEKGLVPLFQGMAGRVNQ
jgi:hypothetical protein